MSDVEGDIVGIDAEAPDDVPDVGPCPEDSGEIAVGTPGVKLRPRDIKYDDYYERDSANGKGVCKVMVTDKNGTHPCGQIISWPGNKQRKAGTTNSVFGHLRSKHADVIAKLMDETNSRQARQANLQIGAERQTTIGSQRADDIALYYVTSGTAYRQIDNIFFKRTFSASLVLKMKERHDVAPW